MGKRKAEENPTTAGDHNYFFSAVSKKRKQSSLNNVQLYQETLQCTEDISTTLKSIKDSIDLGIKAVVEAIKNKK